MTGYTTKPRWATTDVVNPTSGQPNVSEPSEAEKNLGFDRRVKPVRQDLNWLGRQTYLWIDYLDGEVNQFAPHENTNPSMTITVDAGRLMSSSGLIDVAEQNSASITAPSVNPRIDRVTMDPDTGALTVITGAESATPSAPAIPAGALPIAQIYLTTSTTTIVNADITDERVLFDSLAAGGTVNGDMYVTGFLSVGDAKEAWNATYEGAQLGDNIAVVSSTADGSGATVFNAYFDGAWKRRNAGYGVLAEYDSGTLIYQGDPASAAADASLTFTALMSLDFTAAKVGIGSFSVATKPASKLAIYESSAADVYAQWVNSATGVTATDGFIVGIDSTGKGIVNVQENLALEFYTADAFAGKITNTQGWIFGDEDAALNFAGIHVHDADSVITGMQVTNNASGGDTATDGAFVGITATSVLQVWNFEDTDLELATNNTSRLVIDNDGSVYATSATGGPKGIGTANFKDYFKDGNPLSDSYLVKGFNRYILQNVRYFDNGLSRTEALNALAYDPTGNVIVAVGTDDATDAEILISKNYGQDWTHQASSTGPGQILYDVLWDETNDLFIAVGGQTDFARVVTSPDGITWTARTTPNGADDDILRAIATDGTTIVAVGNASSSSPYDYYIIYSTNGTTWTESSGLAAAGPNAFLGSLTYSGSNFVAVGSTGFAEYIATSPDGDIWTSRTPPVIGETPVSVGSNGSGTVIGVSANYIIRSTDHGVTWNSTALSIVLSGAVSKVRYIDGLFMFYAFETVKDLWYLITTADGIDINYYPVKVEYATTVTGGINDFLDIGGKVFILPALSISNVFETDFYQQD